MDKKSIVNDLYQAVVISIFTVGYSMLGKKMLKMTPPRFKSLIWKTWENWLLTSLPTEHINV